MFSWGGTWYLSNEESEGILRKQESPPKESMIWNQSRIEKKSQVQLKLHITEERLRLTDAAVFLVWNLILIQWRDWRYPQEARILNETTPKKSMIWNQSRSEKKSQVRLKSHITEGRLKLTDAVVFLVWNLILIQWGDWRYLQEATIPNESYYPTR